MDEQHEVVGRRDELAAIASFLAEARRGPAALVFTGGAGMGKSTVWQAGVRQAAADGLRVLAARPSGAEAKLSFAGLADLLAPLEPARLEALPSAQRHALDVALLRAEAGPAGIDARAVATAVLSLLRELAAVEPVLVAVDDAQWLDGATAAALAFALRRLGEARVGVLAAVRVERTRPRTFTDALPPATRADVELPPLSVAATYEVVLRRLGQALPRPTVVRITEATGGNPFYACEVAAELVRLGRISTAGPLPLPDELRTLLRARFERLPRRTRDALLTAACLGVPTTRLVDAGALAPAEDAAVVTIAEDGRISFAHPLLAAAVYESAATARRRAEHRELARRVADPEERARHLALGCDEPDAAVARQLDVAAVLARARGAPVSAVELVELALRLTPDGAAVDRVERLLLAAALRFDTGDLAGAQARLEQALAEAPGGSLRVRALRLLAQVHGRRSSFAQAIASAHEALQASGDDAASAAGIQLDIAFYRVSLGDFDGAEAPVEAAVGAAEAAADDLVLAPALAVLTMVRFLSGKGLDERMLARSLSLGEPPGALPLVLRPRFIHGLLLIWTARLDEAVAILDALRLESLEQGRDGDVPFIAPYLVWARLWQGNVAAAARVAQESAQAARLVDDVAVEGITLSSSALVHAHTGEAEAARAEATRAIALLEQLHWFAGTIWARWALGFLELSAGDARAADAALAPAAELVTGLGSSDPVLAVFLPDAVEALVELGRHERAEELLEPFEARARALDRPRALAVAARCRGLLAAARGDTAGALAFFERALREHDRIDQPLERARTMLVLGRVLRRAKQRRRAADALREALAAFEGAGVALWAERAREELARTRSRTAASGLTATEERLARLAAEGLTNREIAERAFVTVKTVEANLARVYRKLGIAARAQLARALEERAAPPIL